MLDTNLGEINGIGEATIKRLKKAKITSTEQLASSSIEELTKIKGIGKSTARSFISGAKNLLIESKSKPKSNQGEFEVKSEIIKDLQKNFQILNSRLDVIESRLDKLEKSKRENFNEPAINKPRIEDQKIFSQILRERVQDLSKKQIGSKKIPIKELYDDISKNYDINKEIFSNILLNLYNQEKIQLEPGTIDNDFSIRDNFGNIYKIIRLL